jgi:hypothetical protein
MENGLPRPPPGFKFVPTEEELINYYLYNKIHGRFHGEDVTLIKDYDLYGEEEPWEIFNKFQGHKFGDNGLYFLTTLHKKTTNGIKNMNRSVGTHGGTWHGDGGKEVKSSEGVVIGTKKRFRYHKHGKPAKDGWILLEYGSESISENIVISQLKKSERGSSNKEPTSRKRKHINAEVFEVAEDDDILKIMQSIVINSIPIRSPALEPQQIIQNQDTWLEAATVSMELGASVTVDSGPDLSLAQEPQQITANQEMWLEAASVAWENDGGFSTAYSFDDEISFVNGEPVGLQFEPGLGNFVQEPMINEHQQPMINEHQQMALACFSGNHEEKPISVEDYELMGLSEATFQ